MGKAILITGFNNWGKSRLIFELFNQQRFVFGRTFHLTSVNQDFVVETHSNDDYNQADFIERVTRRMQGTMRNENLICGFCPTREQNNSALEILQSPVFQRFDEIYLFLLRYKWDHHAELMIQNLRTHFQNAGVTLVEINADAQLQNDAQSLSARVQQVTNEVNNVF